MSEGLRKSYNGNDIVKSLKLMYFHVPPKFKFIYYLYVQEKK